MKKKNKRLAGRNAEDKTVKDVGALAGVSSFSLPQAPQAVVGLSADEANQGGKELLTDNDDT